MGLLSPFNATPKKNHKNPCGFPEGNPSKHPGAGHTTAFICNDSASPPFAKGTVDHQGWANFFDTGGFMNMAADQNRGGGLFDQAAQPRAPGMPAPGNPIPNPPGRRVGDKNRSGIDQGGQVIQPPAFKPTNTGSKGDRQGTADADDPETIEFTTLAIKEMQLPDRGHRRFDPAGIGIAAYGQDRSGQSRQPGHVGVSPAVVDQITGEDDHLDLRLRRLPGQF